MAKCKDKFTTFKGKPLCYKQDGTFYQGTYNQVAKDGKLISQSWYDSNGGEIKEPANIVECPDCSKSQPVTLCNSNTTMLGASACFQNADKEEMQLQPVIKEVNGAISVTGYLDEHGRLIDFEVFPCGEDVVPPCEGKDDCYIMRGFSDTRDKYVCPPNELQKNMEVTAVVDGLGTKLNYATCSVTDNKFESSWYTPLIDFLNATGFVKVELQKDVYLQFDKDTNAQWGNGLVQYLVTIDPCVMFDIEVFFNGNYWIMGSDGAGSTYAKVNQKEGSGLPIDFTKAECVLMVEDPDPIKECNNDPQCIHTSAFMMNHIVTNSDDKVNFTLTTSTSAGNTTDVMPLSLWDESDHIQAHSYYTKFVDLVNSYGLVDMKLFKPAPIGNDAPGTESVKDYVEYMIEVLNPCEKFNLRMMVHDKFLPDRPEIFWNIAGDGQGNIVVTFAPEDLGGAKSMIELVACNK